MGMLGTNMYLAQIMGYLGSGTLIKVLRVQGQGPSGMVQGKTRRLEG